MKFTAILAVAAFGASVTHAIRPVVADDAPIRLSLNIEIAGAGETNPATNKELQDSGTPMVPAKPSASFRDPMQNPAQQKGAAASPAAAAQPQTPAQQTIPARSEDTRRFYARIDTGMALSNDPDASGRNGSHRVSDVGNAGLMSAGLGTWLGDAVRLEGAVSLRTDMDIDGTDGVGNTISGEVRSADGMINIYYDFIDLPPLTGAGAVTPYVGAGVGLSMLKTGTLTTQGAVGEGGKRTFNIAYAVMAGITAPMSDDISLDLGYRLANLGDFEQNGTFGDGTTAQKTDYDDLLSHEFRAGLRFDF